MGVVKFFIMFWQLPVFDAFLTCFPGAATECNGEF